MSTYHEVEIRGDEDVECVCPRYAALVMLVRHLLALEDHGTYANGIPPDDVLFTKTWVRARVRGAIRPGVLCHDEHSDLCGILRNSAERG